MIFQTMLGLLKRLDISVFRCCISTTLVYRFTLKGNGVKTRAYSISDDIAGCDNDRFWNRNSS